MKKGWYLGRPVKIRLVFNVYCRADGGRPMCGEGSYLRDIHCPILLPVPKTEHEEGLAIE